MHAYLPQCKKHILAAAQPLQLLRVVGTVLCAFNVWNKEHSSQCIRLSIGHATRSSRVRWWVREGASRLNQRVVAGWLTYLYHTDCKRQLHTPTSHRVDNPAPSSQVPQTPNPRLCFHAFEPMFVCVRYAQGGGGRGGASGAVTIVTDKGTFQVPPFQLS